jgi:hypothetical protein
MKYLIMYTLSFYDVSIFLNNGNTMTVMCRFGFSQGKLRCVLPSPADMYVLTQSMLKCSVQVLWSQPNYLISSV